MKIKLERVYENDFSQYKSVLDKYNVEYIVDDGLGFVLIEVEYAKELFTLANELGNSLIINYYDENRVTICDDYME